MPEPRAALVTAVIPTRNRLPWLKQAVSSALKQDGVGVDVVVVDEGSSDGTTEWLSSHSDARLRFVRHDTPRKLPGARNAGLELVTTPWVAFLDDDDLWAPRKIRMQLDEAERVGARWCYAGEVTVDADLHVIDIPAPPAADELPVLLPMRNIVPAGGSGVLIDVELIRSVGGFDEDLIACEDWECWLRVLKSGAKPAGVLDPLVAYRWAATSMSMEVERMRTAYRQVRQRHPIEEGAARLALARNERALAFNLARHGNWRESLAALRRSAKPFPLRHAVLAVWVLAMHREWPTRTFRAAGSASKVTDAEAWLSGYRQVASRLA